MLQLFHYPNDSLSQINSDVAETVTASSLLAYLFVPWTRGTKAPSSHVACMFAASTLMVLGVQTCVRRVNAK